MKIPVGRGERGELERAEWVGGRRRPERKASWGHVVKTGSCNHTEDLGDHRG